MIFRTSDGPRILLAATPIFREWKRRCLGDVLVETYHPEILAENDCVDFAGREVTDCSESVIDFDMVEWWERPRPVTETYAVYALRDIRLGSWRTEMYPNEELERASWQIGAIGGNAALVGAGVSDDVCEILNRMGYNTMSLNGIPMMEIAALAHAANLYVGLEGDEASVVLTSDIPAVVLHSWMSPEFFKPFRRGIPYKVVRIRETVCKDALFCSEKGIRAELGKVYGPRCTHDREMCCLGSHTMEDIEKALRGVVGV